MARTNIESVAIIGGIHGNERTGVEVIRRLSLSHLRKTFPALNCHLFMGNPRAIVANQRYIDRDLNRCFLSKDLKASQPIEYEVRRAQQLAQQIKAAKIDLIVDLHTTTASMGTTLILNHAHPILLSLAAHICSVDPGARILQYANQEEVPYVRGLCGLGLTIELGAVPQYKFVPEAIATTRRILWCILSYLQELCQGQSRQSSHCTVYQQIETLDYPRDAAGKIFGQIASHVKDFQALKPGMPLFYSPDGDITRYKGSSTVYPIFIGEAAYREKGIAMALTRQKTLAIQSAC